LPQQGQPHTNDVVGAQDAPGFVDSHHTPAKAAVSLSANAVGCCWMMWAAVSKGLSGKNGVLPLPRMPRQLSQPLEQGRKRFWLAKKKIRNA